MAERTYRISEFALLAGVTVRALHHYDRLGLLKPRRTQTRYHVYSARDLETLAGNMWRAPQSATTDQAAYRRTRAPPSNNSLGQP
jgi:hypothetical protein